MRILSVTAQKPHSTGSGVYLTELVKGFHRLGHEQAVVAGIYKEDIVCFPGGTDFYPVYFKSDELPFSIAGMSDEMPYESTIYSQMTEKMTKNFMERFSKVLAQTMEEFKPDIILCHHLYLLTALVREKYPDQKVVGLCHGSDLRQIKKTILERNYIKENIRMLNEIFVLHDEQASDVAAIFKAENEKIKVIGTGFNQEIFRNMSIERKTDHINLIFAGKLSKAKGVFSLIRCLEYLPFEADRLTLKLAGGYGNEKEYAAIYETARTSRYSVEFLGQLNQEALAREMNKSDMFILPSFYEGLPLVIIEALACGAKVVSTDLPGVKVWMDRSLPYHGIVFVKPPKMERIDEPAQGEEPAFERRLAEGIELSLGQDNKNLDMSGLSWDGICRKMLSLFTL